MIRHTRCTIQKAALFILAAVCIMSCDSQNKIPVRPQEPWAFRSVLDRKPRMLTLALDSSFYASYDLTTCNIYKVWKGGVLMEGTAYSDKKNVQPTSWGTAYIADSTAKWSADRNGNNELSRMQYKGYYFKDNQIYL